MLVTRRTQDFMPALFNELMNMGNVSYATPQMNIIESKEDYKVQFSVPGLTKDDLRISINAEGNLIVEMAKENKAESHDEARRYLRHEFSVEQFRQTIMLPEDIHREQITAKVENGILEIVLPKVTMEEKKKLIQTIEVNWPSETKSQLVEPKEQKPKLRDGAIRPVFIGILMLQC